MQQDSKSRLDIILVDKNPDDLKKLEALVEKVVICNVRSTHSVQSAVQEIEQYIPDLIITEWQLADNDAGELLQIIRKRTAWHDIPVIICTSTRSEDIRHKANQLGVYDFLIKPVNKYILSWNIGLLFSTPELQSTVDLDATAEEADYRKRLDRQKISRISALAPLPELAQKIMELTHEPTYSPKKLAELIKQDQSLTAKILKIVNSAYYGFHRKIGNIDRAIVILGFNEITNITIAACLMQVFPNGSESRLFNREKFWLHTLGAAYIARALSSFAKGVNRRDAFTMGLLHDIGKVVMDQYFNDVFNHLLESAKERDEPLHKLSHELLGVDHAQIGGIIAESWKLPPRLVRAIELHHNPSLARVDDYGVHIIHLANYFCHSKKIGASGNPVPDKHFDGSLIALRQHRKSLEEIWDSLNINADSIRLII